MSKSSVFDGVFYYHHPLRVKGADGKPQPQKTWNELKILLKAIGAPDTIKANEVMFFDDQLHYSLLATLGAKYIKVSEYKYNPPLESVLDIYYSSLKNSDLVTEKKRSNFLRYSSLCTGDKTFNSVEDQLHHYMQNPSKFIRASGTGQVPTSEPLGSNFMLSAIINNSQNALNKNVNSNANLNAAFGRKRPTQKSKTLKMPNNKKGRKKTGANKIWSNY